MNPVYGCLGSETGHVLVPGGAYLQVLPARVGVQGPVRPAHRWHPASVGEPIRIPEI
jgi:hypothetical protein